MKTALLIFLLPIVFCISCKTEVPVKAGAETELDYDVELLALYIRETDSLCGEPGTDKMIFALPDSGLVEPPVTSSWCGF